MPGTDGPQIAAGWSPSVPQPPGPASTYARYRWPMLAQDDPKNAEERPTCILYCSFCAKTAHLGSSFTKCAHPCGATQLAPPGKSKIGLAVHMPGTDSPHIAAGWSPGFPQPGGPASTYAKYRWPTYSRRLDPQVSSAGRPHKYICQIQMAHI